MMSRRSFSLLCPRLSLLILACGLAAFSWLAGEAAAGDPATHYLPFIARLWPPPTPTPGPGRLVISEVMYNPAGTETRDEWIEIYNAGGSPIDLSVYKIGDEETPGQGEGMLQFPAGASILPGQVLVIANQAIPFAALYGTAPDYELRESDPTVPNLLKYLFWASGSVELVNSGDEIILLNEYDQPVDALSWGDSTAGLNPPVAKVADGHSLERQPADTDNGTAADWIDQAQPGPGQVDINHPMPTASPTVQAEVTFTPFSPAVLLISEVVYDPSGASDPAGEWIEIYNAGGSYASLQDYKLGDEETSGQGEGMLQFPVGAGISPGQTAVVANKAAVFSTAYGFLPDYELTDSDPAVPEMIPYPSWTAGSLSLSNAGDEVLLLGAGDLLVDAPSWGSSAWAFDPAVPALAEGHSVERRPAMLDTDTAVDWADQPQPGPGNVDLLLPTATSSPTPGNPPTPTPTSLAPAHLLVSEVFYDPLGNEASEEWIEIYNPSPASADLSSYKIGDEETLGGSEGTFSFPPGARLAPGEKAVVALKAASFFALYGFNPDFEIGSTNPGVPDLAKYSAWSSGSLALSNAGDEVLLFDGRDAVVDAVTFKAGVYPGVDAHPGVSEGHSLERYPAGQDTDDCSRDFVDRSQPTPKK